MKTLIVGLIGVGIIGQGCNMPKDTIARNNGTICRRITDDKAGCENLEGTWDSKNNCCKIAK